MLRCRRQLAYLRERYLLHGDECFVGWGKGRTMQGLEAATTLALRGLPYCTKA
jgi:hypothetical protein